MGKGQAVTWDLFFLFIYLFTFFFLFQIQSMLRNSLEQISLQCAKESPLRMFHRNTDMACRKEDEKEEMKMKTYLPTLHSSWGCAEFHAVGSKSNQERVLFFNSTIHSKIDRNKRRRKKL